MFISCKSGIIAHKIANEEEQAKRKPMGGINRIHFTVHFPKHSFTSFTIHWWSQLLRISDVFPGEPVPPGAITRT